MKHKLLLLLCILAASMSQAQVGVGYYRSGYGSVQKTQDVGPLTREGNIYYYHGKPMKRAEMVQLLNDNCKEAYEYYRKQQKIEKAGWGIFGAGAIICVGLGVPVLFIGEHNKDQIAHDWYNHPEYNYKYGYYQNSPEYKSAEATWGAGLGLICIGAVSSVLIGIPMVIAGNVQKKNAHKVFNTWCGYKELEEQETSRLELRLQTSSNGLGVALVF